MVKNKRQAVRTGASAFLIKKLLLRAVDDGKKGIGISCADEIGMI
ncbi:MAG: hypothetical protein ACQEWW_01770 [Bacillota bacterium]